MKLSELKEKFLCRKRIVGRFNKKRGDFMKTEKKRNMPILTPDGRKEVQKKMIDLGMKHREFAEAIGTSANYFNHILHGRKPIGKYAKKMLLVLGFDIMKYTA